MSTTKILGATIESFKRIELCELKLDGSVLEVTGENEQGKSSILDAFEAALGGKRHQPQEPIKRGSEKARVVLDLGDLIVERVWTKKTDRLVVKSKDGAQYPAGQAKLDGLIGGLAFDPMAFLAMKDAEQRATLLELSGVDLDVLEEQRLSAFDQRREAGRDLRAAQARLEGAPAAAKGTPDEEVSIAGLSERLDSESEVTEKHRKLRRECENRLREHDDAVKDHNESLEEIKHCNELLGRAQDEELRLRDVVAKANKVSSAAERKTRNLVDPDMDATRREIGEADSINIEVRKAQYLSDLSVEVDQLQRDHDAQEARLGNIADEKAALLASAEMPVDGLAITDDGVTFEDLPLSQASMSRRIRVCTAIGAALNPKLRIALVRSGNDFSEKTLREFYDYCAEAKLQAVVERISGITENAIVIEEGRVK